MFQKLINRGNFYYFVDKLPFEINMRPIPKKYISDSLSFAYDMAFMPNGHHRAHRSGGLEQRDSKQIFLDAFHGKIGEFGFYDYFTYLKDYECSKPDLNVYSIGKWDDGDLEVKDFQRKETKHVAIKTTKYYGNLLLLETKDWNENGIYIPSINKDDIYKPSRFVLMRIKPSLDVKVIKPFINTNDYELVFDFIMEKDWFYDIPGFITNDDLQFLIKNDFILPQGSFLCGRTKMDAENYYVQSVDLRHLPKIS